jgi:AcrR family transcriptional regulator
MKTPHSQEMVRLPLTRERVVQAAIRLADEVGVAQLSMRKLAKALNVEAMSLYHHVTGKEDLLDAMVDAVVAQIALPAPEGDWKNAMRGRALSARVVLLSHRWAALLMISRINVGPAMLGHVEAMLHCLRSAGFSYPMADHAEAAKAFLPMLPADRYPHMRALAKQVIEGSHSGLNDFSFGLNIILDGLERLLPKN